MDKNIKTINLGSLEKFKHNTLQLQEGRGQM